VAHGELQQRQLSDEFNPYFSTYDTEYKWWRNRSEVAWEIRDWEEQGKQRGREEVSERTQT